MTSALAIQTRKEVRALLPWTIGVAIACVALGTLANQNAGFPNFRHDQALFFIMAYALGALSLAALSVGQELTHGTLATLLVQPLDRMKMLRLKLVVLAIPLIGLGVMADALFPPGYLPDAINARRLLIWGPVAAGLGMVPLLTIQTRRPLGGVVFAVSIAGLFLTIGTRIYPLQHQALSFTWYCTLVASVAGLAALFVQFRRLEVAGDGRQRAVASPSAHAADVRQADYVPTVRRPWAWLLIKKELRLQQMTFAVSGLYVLAAIAVMMIAHNNPEYTGPSFGAVSVIHAYFIPLIAGAISSAEERHIGTLAGQILMPRNMRLQWAIKAAITIGLALALTIGLPSLLMAIHRPVDAFRLERDFSMGIAIMCAAAMYVSSLSSNSLWALLGCFPVLGVAAMIGSAGRTFLWRLVYTWFPRQSNDSWKFLSRAMKGDESWIQNWATARSAAYADIRYSLNIIETSLIVGFGLLVLYFAARNHRAIDRNMRTVGIQVLILLLFATIAATAYGLTGRLTTRWLTYY